MKWKKKTRKVQNEKLRLEGSGARPIPFPKTAA